jgi:CheY-like chemotaxis protein
MPLERLARPVATPIASPAPATKAAPERPSRAPVLPRGLRVLIVEDEPLLAMELAVEIEEAGGEPVGPASSCSKALELIESERPDLALLDGNLNGERIDVVADALADRRIPFAFVSGDGPEHLPDGHAGRPIIAKPFVATEIVAVVEELATEQAAISLDPVG